MDALAPGRKALSTERGRSAEPSGAGPRLTWLRPALALAAVASVIGLTYTRLYLGIDFTDESFYIAVPYRLALGAKPLVDVTEVGQLPPALLLYPFVLLYHRLFGLDGLVLFMRHLHFAFCLGVAFALYSALRIYVRDRALAAVLACAAVAFVPFGIHGLSYNTFASGFLTAGAFLLAASVLDGSRLRRAIGGAALGLAIFTYPPFALAAGCVLLALLLAVKPRTLRTLAPALIPMVACGLGAAAFFLQRGLGTIENLLNQASTYGGQGGGIHKALGIVFSVVVMNTRALVFGTALVAAALVLRRSRPSAAALCLLALPLAALPPDLSTPGSSNRFVTSLALLAPLVSLAAARGVLTTTLLGIVWVPAAVAGETAAMSSSNGSGNVAIGFFPGAVVTTALLALAVRGTVRTRSHVLRDTLDLVPGITVLAVGVALQYTFVYRDASLSHLTSRIESGAFAGIYTTPQRRDFLAALDRDLATFSGPSCRIVFYDRFPAGYLLGHGRPDTNRVFLIDPPVDLRPAYQRLLLGYFRTRGGLPDLAVRINRIPLLNSAATVQSYRPSDPLERLFRGPAYVTVRSRSDYRIAKRANSVCRAPAASRRSRSGAHVDY